MCVLEYAEARGQLQVLIHRNSLPCFFKIESHRNLGLGDQARLAGQWTPGILLSHPTQPFT